MSLYKARKGNSEIYINPEQIKIFSDMGYIILKEIEEIVKDPDTEMEEALQEVRITIKPGGGEDAN